MPKRKINIRKRKAALAIQKIVNAAKELAQIDAELLRALENEKDRKDTNCKS